jgi:hypothetical protein
MDRRLFLTGMFSLAGVAAVESLVRPVVAYAAMPKADGIIDEIDEPTADVFEEEDTQAEIEKVHRRGRRHRRRRRRREWRRHCRRHWHHGRWRRRCRRRRVWVWYWI